MADAKRDSNFITTIEGVSSTDFVTPINIAVDPATHAVIVTLI